MQDHAHVYALPHLTSAFSTISIPIPHEEAWRDSAGPGLSFPFFMKQQEAMSVAKTNAKYLVFITELCEAGKVVPMIDRCYPLGEVALALWYLGEGHAKGKVAITVEQNDHTEHSP